jgi:hypothetical protein
VACHRSTLEPAMQLARIDSEEPASLPDRVERTLENRAHTQDCTRGCDSWLSRRLPRIELLIPKPGLRRSLRRNRPWLAQLSDGAEVHENEWIPAPLEPLQASILQPAVDSAAAYASLRGRSVDLNQFSHRDRIAPGLPRCASLCRNQVRAEAASQDYPAAASSRKRPWVFRKAAASPGRPTPAFRFRRRRLKSPVGLAVGPGRCW